MIGEDRKNVDVFYSTVCGVISGKKAWHGLSAFGFVDGVCQRCGERHDRSVTRELATAFWEQGADVDENWKRVASAHGLDADDLHETMLGVFIGGDGGRAPSITFTDSVVNAKRTVQIGGPRKA